MAKIVKLIQSEECRGSGTEADPIRTVTQWWTLKGRLLVERDPQVAIDYLRARISGVVNNNTE